MHRNRNCIVTAENRNLFARQSRCVRFDRVKESQASAANHRQETVHLGPEVGLSRRISLCLLFLLASSQLSDIISPRICARSVVAAKDLEISTPNCPEIGASPVLHKLIP